MNCARANDDDDDEGVVGAREASRCRVSHKDGGVWYGGAMPWSGLRNVVRCANSGTVAGVVFQTV